MIYTNQEQKMALRPLLVDMIEARNWRIQLRANMSDLSHYSQSTSMILTEMDCCDEISLFVRDDENEPLGDLFLVWGNGDMPHPVSNFSCRNKVFSNVVEQHLKAIEEAAK